MDGLSKVFILKEMKGYLSLGPPKLKCLKVNKTSSPNNADHEHNSNKFESIRYL